MAEPFDEETPRRKIWGVSPNAFFLGIVSFLTDVSSEMIFTLVPLLLFNVLGAATVVVGLIGGLSESIDALFRMFSGWFSDRIGKRKSLAVAGYTISTVAKPFMYLASTWGMVLGVRFGDRVGKGIRTAPRDALVAQFGPEGLLAHEWASGVDERPLVPRAKPAVLEEERCCETAVDTLDGLVALVSDLLDRLVPRLKGRNQVCRQVRLRLDFDDGGSSLAVFTLKAAGDSKGEMLGYLKRRLDGTCLPSAVTGIGLGLAGLGPSESVQGSLALHRGGEHRERARQLVRNLRLRWGSNPLKVVAPLDPVSRIPERRARLVDFEP